MPIIPAAQKSQVRGSGSEVSLGRNKTLSKNKSTAKGTRVMAQVV
jgi:hypothetical protein